MAFGPTRRWVRINKVALSTLIHHSHSWQSWSSLNSSAVLFWFAFSFHTCLAISLDSETENERSSTHDELNTGSF